MAVEMTASVGVGVGREALPVIALTMPCAYVMRSAIREGSLRMADGVFVTVLVWLMMNVSSLSLSSLICVVRVGSLFSWVPPVGLFGFVSDCAGFVGGRDGRLFDCDGSDFDFDGRVLDRDGFDFDLDGRVLDRDGFDFDLDGRVLDRDGFDFDLDGRVLDRDSFDSDLDGRVLDRDGFDFDLEGRVF